MELINFTINFITAMSLGEQLSIATGLIYILLSVRQNPLCWPFGIVSVAIWMVIVFQGKLYSDAFLQFVYVVLGFYGWYQWLRGGTGNTPLKVQRVDRKLGDSPNPYRTGRFYPHRISNGKLPASLLSVVGRFDHGAFPHRPIPAGQEIHRKLAALDHC